MAACGLGMLLIYLFRVPSEQKDELRKEADPNGLCYYKGRWHVFYQLHPYGTQWGPMHWGHVSSTDMVNWKREPVMFAPSLEQEKNGVFSGSAVIDDNGDLRFYYTGHRWANGHDNTGGDWQVQMTALPLTPEAIWKKMQETAR